MAVTRLLHQVSTRNTSSCEKGDWSACGPPSVGHDSQQHQQVQSINSPKRHKHDSGRSETPLARQHRPALVNCGEATTLIVAQTMCQVLLTAEQTCNEIMPGSGGAITCRKCVRCRFHTSAGCVVACCKGQRLCGKEPFASIPWCDFPSLPKGKLDKTTPQPDRLATPNQTAATLLHSSTHAWDTNIEEHLVAWPVFCPSSNGDASRQNTGPQAYYCILKIAKAQMRVAMQRSSPPNKCHQQ